MSDIRQSNVVEVDNLGVSFGRLRAVDDLSFSVKEGSVYGLLGRNGSGKSTTIKCLLGQLKPQLGTAQVLGRDAWKDRKAIMSRVGVVPETADIPGTMTPALVARFLSPLYERWNQEMFEEKLRQFEIPLDHGFSMLSKGQRKQVTLASALAIMPDFLVLDDPTLGLDAVARKILYDELITELADRGTTTLVTTHDLTGIEGVADEIGILHGGHLLASETLETFKARFRRFRLSAEHHDSWEQDGSSILSRRRLGDQYEIVVSNIDEQSLPPGVSSEVLSLEEAFLALCGREQIS